MKNDRDEHGIIFKLLDAYKEWAETAYDEFGNAVTCNVCGEEMKWNALSGQWYCPSCGREMSRGEYFDYILATPPGVDCLVCCRENYPFCKKTCMIYSIDPTDPMLL